MFSGIAVRKFLLFVLISLASLGARAWDPAGAETSPEGAPAMVAPQENLVTIAPVPAPATVVQLASYAPKNTNVVRQAKKLKAEKVATSMLSRAVRGQIALVKNAASGDAGKLAASDDEDDDHGLDDQDLHRSFSQPKVAKTSKQKDDEDQADLDLPDHIKLRLFMARTKAVEAHLLSQAARAAEQDQTALPEHIQSRLAEARARAIKAHADKFGQA